MPLAPLAVPRGLGTLLVLLLLGAGGALAQSARSGMGGVPYDGGVTFRVWAPHADRVTVSGSFNEFNPDASPLVREATGDLWSTDIAGAAVGDEYRYVITNGSTVVTRRDPHSRLVTSSNYSQGQSIVYDPDAFVWKHESFTPPALEDLVIYEMHVGTFNDGPEEGPGTFALAIERLDHLAALGVTAVQVLPVYEVPGLFPSGYGPSDIFAVENRKLGGPDGFKAFVDACHARGIAVLLDVVYNHWGPWDLATHRFDGWWSSEWPGGIYFYDDARIDSPWGPRPNYSRPEVRRYIYDNLRMWTEEYRVDGFRWDATSNIYDTNGGSGTPLPDGWRLLREAHRGLDRFYPATISIAEDLRNDPAITRPLGDGGAGFDSQWHFFHAHLRSTLKKQHDANRSMPFVRHALTHTYNGDPFQRVIYTESHNEVCCGNDRLTVEIDEADPDSWEARKLSTLGAAILLTSPGIPMLWQGQELLDPTPFDGRAPMRWNGYVEHPGIVRLYRDLIHLRLDRNGTTGGLKGRNQNVYVTEDTHKVIALHRWDEGGPGDDVIVVANFSGETFTNAPLGLPRAGRWTVRFNSDATTYSPDFGDIGSMEVEANGPTRNGMAQSGRLTLGPYSVLILSQEPPGAGANEAAARSMPELLETYPSPFASRTTIRYSLAETSRVRLAVYDVLGRQVAVLADGPETTGTHEVVFEAANLPSGVYVVRLEAGHHAQTQRVTLLK